MRQGLGQAEQFSTKSRMCESLELSFEIHLKQGLLEALFVLKYGRKQTFIVLQCMAKVHVKWTAYKYSWFCTGCPKFAGAT